MFSLVISTASTYRRLVVVFPFPIFLFFPFTICPKKWKCFQQIKRQLMCEIHTHTHESRSKTQTHFITKYLYSRPDDVTSLGTSSREFCFFFIRNIFCFFFWDRNRWGKMERPKKRIGNKVKTLKGVNREEEIHFSPSEYFIILLSDEPQTTVPNHRRPEICGDFEQRWIIYFSYIISIPVRLQSDVIYI